ncbi:MAG: hypothetical protein CMJ19_08960 [Phycisphaeraceae bacterium]|mgnify:CR=1 FL=1|nr:hypothetical protein [Phycisphaeraceae bacterium]
MKHDDKSIKQLWAQLEPVGYGDTLEYEPWPSYWERIRKLIPNFPPEACKQWLWQHYSCTTEYDWLNLRTLDFRREEWPTQLIFEKVREWPDTDGGLLTIWSNYIRTSPDAKSNQLANYMTYNGTWPLPPLIIENPKGITRPDGYPLGEPFHLMEGHHRLGFLHGLAKSQTVLQEKHSLFIITVQEDGVFDHHPLNTNYDD